MYPCIYDIRTHCIRVSVHPCIPASVHPLYPCACVYIISLYTLYACIPASVCALYPCMPRVRALCTHMPCVRVHIVSVLRTHGVRISVHLCTCVLRRLKKKGCTQIQIDEPLFARRPDEAIAWYCPSYRSIQAHTFPYYGVCTCPGDVRTHAYPRICTQVSLIHMFLLAGGSRRSSAAGRDWTATT